MTNLISINKASIGGAQINSVNAREIHTYLKVKTKFADWIKRAIQKYDFEENIDFSILRNGNPGGGIPVLEYIVTLEMAKELAMLENNPKGKETRKYFINFENQSKQLIQQQSQEIQLLQGMLNTISKMDTRVSNTEEKLDYLENKAPILYNQIKVLEDKRKSITKELVGYNPNDAISKANYSRTIRAITKKFKDRFGIARYADLPKDKYNEALQWLNNVKLIDLI